MREDVHVLKRETHDQLNQENPQKKADAPYDKNGRPC